MKGKLCSLINRYKTLSPAAKASIALLFARLFVKGLSVISAPIFTRIMSTSQYGDVSTFTSWESVIMIVVTLNLSSGVFNNGMLDFKQDRDSFMYSSLCVASISTLIWFALFFAFRGFFFELFGVSTQVMAVFFAYCLVEPAFEYWSGRQRYEFKYKKLTLVTILSAVLSTALSIIVVLTQPDENKAEAKIIAGMVVPVIIGIIFYIYITAKSRAKAKLSYIKYAVRFNLPLIPHYLSMYVLSSSDRIMITRLTNSANTAIYSVAYSAASVVTLLWTSIEASLAPWMYEEISKGNKAGVRKRTFQLLCLFAGVSIFATLFAPEIIMILAPEDYYEGIYLIPPITAGVFFTAVYGVYMRIELYYKNTTFISIMTVVAAGTNVVLNYLFISGFGYVAAAYTTVICYVMLALLHYVNVKRLGMAEYVSNRNVALLALAVILVMVGVSMIYSYTLARYLLIVITALIIAVKRKTVMSVIKNQK